jgi:hypothetical protein
MTIWYRQGTTNVINGSTAVTGVLTGWLSQVKDGDGITFDSGSTWYEVAGITENTAITLATPYQGVTASGLIYAIDRSSPRWTLASEVAIWIAELLKTRTDLLSGDGPPAANLGGDGSLYIDKLAFTYTSKVGATWGNPVSMRGPAGIQGIPGQKGADSVVPGPTGPAADLSNRALVDGSNMTGRLGLTGRGIANLAALDQPENRQDGWYNCDDVIDGIPSWWLIHIKALSPSHVVQHASSLGGGHEYRRERAFESNTSQVPIWLTGDWDRVHTSRDGQPYSNTAKYVAVLADIKTSGKYCMLGGFWGPDVKPGDPWQRWWELEAHFQYPGWGNVTANCLGSDFGGVRDGVILYQQHITSVLGGVWQPWEKRSVLKAEQDAAYAPKTGLSHVAGMAFDGRGSGVITSNIGCTNLARVSAGVYDIGIAPKTPAGKFQPFAACNDLSAPCIARIVSKAANAAGVVTSVRIHVTSMSGALVDGSEIVFHAFEVA